MIKHLLLAVAASAIMSSSVVAAEYYIIQEKSSKKCKVVDVKPKETTWMEIGGVAFKTRDEADKQVAVVCKKKG
jgi:hypothetical protein